LLFEQTGPAAKRSPVKFSDSSIAIEIVMSQAVLLEEKKVIYINATVYQLSGSFCPLTAIVLVNTDSIFRVTRFSSPRYTFT